MSLLFSRSNKPSKKIVTCFHDRILLGLFDPEDGGDMFLRNDGWLSTGHIALYPRLYYSSNIAFLNLFIPKDQ
jgi:hypothetical protein